jgi:Kazal-type serine protease inhibitor domain
MKRETAMNTGRMIATALALALTSCTVVVDEPAPPRPGVYPPPPGPQPGLCTRQYRPVCAVRPGERQTFPNGCTAEAEGFRVIYSGECRPVRPPQSDAGPVVCPQIYAPVCARQGSVLRTFPNECQAEGSGFRVIDDGEC